MTPPENLRFMVKLPCAPCEGSGGVPTDAWQAFEDWADRHSLHGPARDHAVEDYFFDERGLDVVPAQRGDCEHCDGVGEQACTLTLGELRLLVADWMVSPLVSAGELDEVVDSLKRSMTAAALKSQGLADPDRVGSWLRACQEAAEALRSVAQLRPRPRD